MNPTLKVLYDNLETHLKWIERCLERLPEAALWKRPRPGLNSVGNLCLHLAGNESHYLGFGVGKIAYKRDRSGEFTADGGTGKEDLLGRLRESRRRTREVLESLRAEDFDRPIEIDHPPDSTVLRIVAHVVEHYAYHTGQIVLLTRLLQEGEERLLDWSH